MRSRQQAILTILALVAGTAASLAQQPAPPTRNDALRLLDAWIEARMGRNGPPGLSIAIVRDQEVIWSRGYGYADPDAGTPATPETRYRIASVSKVFTAAAVMLLRDEGRLRLDDPACNHLAWFTPRDTFAQRRPITVRHLLTHTSGLPRDPLGASFNTLSNPTPAAAIAGLATQDLVFRPGTTFKYSNLGFGVLGQLIEATSGMTFASFLERRILEPVGMHATVVVPTPETAGIAAGYGPRRPDGTRERAGFVALDFGTPAGGLASTALDLARFVSTQFVPARDGVGRILSDGTLREMQRVQFSVGTGGGVGIAWAVEQRPEGVRVSHSGGLPFHSSVLAFEPDRRLGVVVLTNAEDGDPASVVERAFALLGPAIDGEGGDAGGRDSEAIAPDAAWARLAGTYAWKELRFRFMVLSEGPALISPDAADPWATRTRLEPAGPTAFRTHGGWIDGELVSVVVGPDGRGLRLEFPNLTLDWVPPG